NGGGRRPDSGLRSGNRCTSSSGSPVFCRYRSTGRMCSHGFAYFVEEGGGSRQPCPPKSSRNLAQPVVRRKAPGTESEFPAVSIDSSQMAPSAELIPSTALMGAHGMPKLRHL